MDKDREVFWDAADLMRRLRRIEGQVRGIETMVLEEKSCQSVLIQVAAIEGAIKQISRIVSACSVAERVTSIVDRHDESEAIRKAIKELINYA